MMSDRAKHWHANWMEHIGVSIIVHKCERSCRDKTYFTEYFTYGIDHDVWRDERSVPAATLGACSGIICLIGFWFQFECLCSKFLSHPKVLERFKQPTHMNTKENINGWFAYDNSQKLILWRLTFIFLRHRDRLRKSDTLSSLNVLRSSLKPSRGNFLRAYW